MDAKAKELERNTENVKTILDAGFVLVDTDEDIMMNAVMLPIDLNRTLSGKLIFLINGREDIPEVTEFVETLAPASVNGAYRIRTGIYLADEDRLVMDVFNAIGIDGLLEAVREYDQSEIKVEWC